MHFCWKIVYILRYFVGYYKVQRIVFVGEYSYSVVQLASQIKWFASWLSSADCSISSSLHFYWFFFAPHNFLRSKIVPIDNVCPQIRNEKYTIVFWENTTMRMRTGLPIGIDTASLMSNEWMNGVRNVISQFTNQDWCTWVISYCNKLSSIVDWCLAWIITHCVNSG